MEPLPNEGFGNQEWTVSHTHSLLWRSVAWQFTNVCRQRMRNFPKYAIRRKIDTQVSKTAREHIIIFHDHAKTVQVWQWVKREAGKPSACREQLFYTGQSGDALIQKIQAIAFGLEDEANVTETVAKVGAAFDVEKITKKFYELFKKEHDAFLKFTKGIPDEELEVGMSQ